MPYCEKPEDQNAGLAERYAQVGRYLTQLADHSEVARRQLWDLPPEATTADYEKHTQSLRARVAVMLGYPPPGTPVEGPMRIEEIGADEDGAFYRVHIELLREGMHAYGLLIKPNRPSPTGKSLAVAIHGGMGTPELAAGILGPTNYNDMGRRLARRGHLVWMPACYERVSFDDKALPPVEVHRVLDLKARLVGTTLPAVDAYSIIASTGRVLCSEHCDADHAIAVGLSYGGLRSLVVCALSTLFRACISSCYFNDRRRVLEHYSETGGFSDCFFPNALGIATDVELCRLICPRPLFIEVGTNDELFPVEGAISVSGEVQRLYQSLGVAERFEFDAFAGGHEFSGVKALQFLDRLGL